MVSLSIGIDARLDTAYMMHLCDKTAPFSEIVNTTCFYKDLEKKGKTVLYVVGYGPQLEAMKGPEIIRSFEGHLARLFPQTKGKVAWRRLFKLKTVRTAPILFSLPLLAEKLVVYRGNYLMYYDFRTTRITNILRTVHNVYNAFFKRDLHWKTPFGLLSYQGQVLGEGIAHHKFEPTSGLKVYDYHSLYRQVQLNTNP